MASKIQPCIILDSQVICEGHANACYNVSKDNIQDEFLTEARACFCDGDLWVFAKNIIKLTIPTYGKSIWGKYLTINTSHQVQQRPSWSTLPSAGRSWQFCKPYCRIFLDTLDITFVANLKWYNFKKFYPDISFNRLVGVSLRELGLFSQFRYFRLFQKWIMVWFANHIVGVFLTTFLKIIPRSECCALSWRRKKKDLTKTKKT